MRLRSRAGLSACLAVALLLGGVLASAARVSAKPEDVTFKELKNGLRVVVRPVPDSDVVAIQFWIRGGSRLEPPSRNGITHLLEHMLFKGTTTRSGDQVKREIEDLGGQLNAETTKDSVRVYAVVANEYFSKAFDDLADTVLHPSLPADELSNEKSVILMELARQHSDPVAELSDAVALRAYPSYPYRYPVGGTRETLGGISRDDLVAYHRARVCPRNMSVVVVGGVKVQDVLATVEKTMGSVDPGPAAPPEPAFDKGVDRVVEVPLTGPFPRNVLMFAFRAPSITDPADVYAMDVLLTALGEGRTSRLQTALRGDPPLALAVDSGFLTQRGPGLLTITAVADPSVSEVVRQRVLDIVNDLRTRPLSPDELKGAKAELEGSFVSDSETAEGTASALGFYEAIATYEFGVTYLDHIHAVTSADILRVAQRYLTPDRYVLGRLTTTQNMAALGPTCASWFNPAGATPLGGPWL